MASICVARHSALRWNNIGSAVVLGDATAGSLESWEPRAVSDLAP